jgi:uncharacterized protein YcfL
MKKCALSGVIAFLLVVTVLAAGCMTNETNKNSTQTLSASTSNVTAQTSSISPSNATTVRDATLEKFVNEIHKDLQENCTLLAWNVKWLNSTIVTITFTAKAEVNSTWITFDQSRTIIHFKSTGDATAYLNGLDRAGYESRAVAYPGGFYSKVVGHNPTLFKWYQKQSDQKMNYIYQFDDTIEIAEVSFESS